MSQTAEFKASRLGCKLRCQVVLAEQRLTRNYQEGCDCEKQAMDFLSIFIQEK